MQKRTCSNVRGDELLEACEIVAAFSLVVLENVHAHLWREYFYRDLKIAEWNVSGI